MTQLKEPPKLYYAMLSTKDLAGYLSAGRSLPNDVAWWGYNFPATRTIVDNLAALILSKNSHVQLQAGGFLVTIEDRVHGFEISDPGVTEEEYLGNYTPFRYNSKKPVELTDVVVEAVSPGVKRKDLNGLKLSGKMEGYFASQQPVAA